MSVVLGELVTREVERHRSRRLCEGEIEDRELVDSIDRARVQQAGLAEIVARLERLQYARASDG